MASVRPYREDDVEQCCSIVLACLPQLDGMNEAARRFLEAKMVPERLHHELASMEAFVYEDGGSVLGLAALDGMEAKRLYVSPAAQGKGIGRKLYQHLEDLARSRGLTVLTGDASPAAAGFYQGLGFLAEGNSETLRGDAHFKTVRVFKRL